MNKIVSALSEEVNQWLVVTQKQQREKDKKTPLLNS